MQETKPEPVDPLVIAALGKRWRALLLQGLVLLGLGLLAIALPAISTLAIEFVIGATLVVAGAYRVAATLVTGAYAGSWLGLAGGVLALAFGAALFIDPTAGAITLTSLLGVLFLVQGVLSLVMALRWRGQLGRWLWIAGSGCVDLILALLILAGLPGAADWVLGLMLGVNLVMLGAALAGIALEVRPH